MGGLGGGGGMSDDYGLGATTGRILSSVNSYSGGTTINYDSIDLGDWDVDNLGRGLGDKLAKLEVEADMPAGGPVGSSSLESTMPVAANKSRLLFEEDGKGGEDYLEEERKSQESSDIGGALDARSDSQFTAADFAENSLKDLPLGYSAGEENGRLGLISMEWRRRGPVAGKPEMAGRYPYHGGWGAAGVDYSWFNKLFAPLPPPPAKPQEPKQPWPAEARAIARSLLRTEHLTGVKDGLQIETQTESFDPRWDDAHGPLADQGHRLSPAAG